MVESPLAAVRASLAADRANLRAAVERVPAAARGRRPAPDRWSVAEVIEHLAIVEERTVGALAPLVATAPPLGTPRLATHLDRTALRDRTLRVVAPELIQPSGTVDADTAWAALDRSRAALLAVLDTAEGRDLTTIGRTHPRLGQLDGYQWIASIGGHEERHAAQILEIADALAAQA
jgi:hypothetical protein